MSQARPVHVELPGRYRLDGYVAAGGMAAVYAAHDTLLDRPVAVKVLAEHLNADDSARQRFQREARAAAGLSSHPNVVTIFDVGEHEGRSFIVMELLSGGTVGDRLRAGPVVASDALRWLRETASALDAAHERGITHRDIKPGNLLLDDRGSLAVADFGIARLAEEDAITQTGTVLGTAAYISPEQALGRPATAASDRYALGVVAFELLTGRRPFEADNFAAQARAQIEDPPPRPSAYAEGLPPAVDDVIIRALAKEPEERWATAAEFVDALEDALAGEGATAATAPLTPTAPTRAAVPLAPIAGPGGDGSGGRLAGRPRPLRRPAPPSREARTRNGSRALVALGLLLLAFALVALLAGALGGDEGRQAADEPRATPTREAERERDPTPTATAPAEPETPAQPAPAGEPAGGDPTQLNNEGYALFQRGQYAESVPYFRKAVDACGGGGPLDPCGFAMYNLGAALNRSGNPAEAIPILQQRLAGWDNQTETVRAELASACAAAGQDCELDGESDDGGKGKGKGKGKLKDD